MNPFAGERGQEDRYMRFLNRWQDGGELTVHDLKAIHRLHGMWQKWYAIMQNTERMAYWQRRYDRLVKELSCLTPVRTDSGVAVYARPKRKARTTLS